ncbi:MAG: HNH endonuclease signature motif containing protein [Clostridia bacterium]
MSNIKTRIPEIINYWENKIDESEMGADWCDIFQTTAKKGRCWRCGYEKKLHRCHIIPDSLGGKDEPSNYVLLCGPCHSEAPNVIDTNAMWEWIKITSKESFAGCCDTFWIMKGFNYYKEMYGKSFWEECNRLYINTDLSIDKIDKLVQYHLNRISLHFSGMFSHASPKLTPSTIAFVLHKVIKFLERNQTIKRIKL